MDCLADIFICYIILHYRYFALLFICIVIYYIYFIDEVVWGMFHYGWSLLNCYKVHFSTAANSLTYIFFFIKWLIFRILFQLIWNVSKYISSYYTHISINWKVIKIYDFYLIGATVEHIYISNILNNIFYIIRDHSILYFLINLLAIFSNNNRDRYLQALQ